MAVDEPRICGYELDDDAHPHDGTLCTLPRDHDGLHETWIGTEHVVWEQPIVDDEERVEIEIPAVTAPVFPYEMVLNDSHTFYQRTIGGGMDVKLVPVVQTPSGRAPALPATVVRFNADGWERFKREVAADGEKAPLIETVRTFPGGLLNGEGR